MLSLRSYFVFAIFVMGTMLVAEEFTKEGELFCNDHQQNEGNEVRNKS